MVTGKCFISGHWFKALRKPTTNEIIGTRIFYVNCCYFGGNIPSWIYTQFIPKAV